MNHAVDGRKFGRNTSHRLAMFRNMANCVIEKEQIITTVQKAKEIRRVVERLITLAKKGTPASRRLAFDRTRNDVVVAKLFEVLKDRYDQRSGGYTRILKMADRRWGDAAEMAVLELVDHPVIDRKRKVKPVPAEGESDPKAAPEVEAQMQDPLKKFRRLFNPKQKVKGGAHGAQGMQSKRGARKTPSASNKTGSSG